MTPKTEAEELALTAWRKGVEADCRQLPNKKKRTVRGAFLARLLKGQLGDADADVLDLTFRLKGARVDGEVMLNWAVIDRPLRFTDGCSFNAGFNADNAKFKALCFDESDMSGTLFLMDAVIDGQFNANGASFDRAGQQNAIMAQGCRVRGWFMRSTKAHQTAVQGTLSMEGAQIDGQFLAEGASFDSAGQDDAIMAQGCRVGDWFMNSTEAHQTKVRGTLFMEGAQIDGQFLAEGASFDSAGERNAIMAQKAVIRGGVFLRPAEVKKECISPTIIGTALFNSARIENVFEAQGLRLSAPSGVGLNLENAIVDGRIHLNVNATSAPLYAPRLTVTGEVALSGPFGAKIDFSDARLAGFKPPARVPKGGLCLANAHIGVLRDTADSWQPANGVEAADAPITLRGLTYDRLEFPLGGGPNRSWERRLEWLNRQLKDDLGENFTPQPWRQLARALRADGHDTEAREITIARRDAYRDSPSCGKLERWWLTVLDIFGGYGLRPQRTAYWCLAFIGFAWIAFTIGNLACGQQVGCYDGRVFIPIAAGDVEVHGELSPVDYTATFDPTEEMRQTYTPYPSFDPLLYSLDLFVPLVEFGITETWVINDRFAPLFTIPVLGTVVSVGWVFQWIAVVVRFAGTFLSAYLIVGLTGLLTREEN